MLESIELTKKFLGKTAVDGISLKLEPGHIYAMLGPNGSGKTTWMKMAAGLIKPTSGVVNYNGSPVGVDSRRDVAYMSTEPYFYDWMTIGDVGKYYQDFFADFSMEKYDEMLQDMALEKKLKCKNLSSGMLAKLKVAVTMARDAKVYMLDEPLNGIDLLARDEVLNAIIKHAGEDKILLVSSHLVEELESVVDYAIFINRSKLVGVYEVEELRQNQCISLADKYREVFGSIEMGGAC
ncbi:ABC-type multidrug transport system, ATPase component [Butyrivibrio fibrisolvens 16/4]|nr:ABC-type multidrug transport system, ATPase component [Butyrivibrio fibrisolvens 16/4]